MKKPLLALSILSSTVFAQKEQSRLSLLDQMAQDLPSTAPRNSRTQRTTQESAQIGVHNAAIEYHRNMAERLERDLERYEQQILEHNNDIEKALEQVDGLHQTLDRYHESLYANIKSAYSKANPTEIQDIEAELDSAMDLVVQDEIARGITDETDLDRRKDELKDFHGDNFRAKALQERIRKKFSFVEQLLAKGEERIPLETLISAMKKESEKLEAILKKDGAKQILDFAKTFASNEKSHQKKIVNLNKEINQHEASVSQLRDKSQTSSRAAQEHRSQAERHEFEKNTIKQKTERAKPIIPKKR